MKQQLVMGRHPVMDLLGTGVYVDKIYIQQDIRGDYEKELRKNCRELNIRLKVVPKERLNRLVRGNHQGVVALVSPVPIYRVEDLVPGIYERGELPLLMILDGITDVRNFGAIARSAEIFGAQGLIVGMKDSAEINEEAIKASAGALLNIPLCRASNASKLITFLKDSGLSILASDLRAEKQLMDLELSVPLAFVVGSEGKGISRLFREQADECFIIPQMGKTDSLNASVSAGIMLYEASRQRARLTGG